MPGYPHYQVLRRLHPPARGGADRSDADLLDSYAAGHDEAAFEALVRRHGPMVLGVCRRVLRSEPDAEDAFQATFLVLARKAAVVRDAAGVGGWLYGVAHNVARRAKVSIGRRRAVEHAADAPARPPAADSEWHETVALVDDELGRLPAKYRIPIVSCGLGGKTIREAAADLGWPPGTVATRLARGRDLLARRLARRGVAVPAALLATPTLAAALVPERLVELAVRVGVAAGTVPAAVLAITNEVTRSMFVTKLKAVAAAVVLVAGLGAAAVVAQPPRPDPAADPPAKADSPAKADPPAAKREPTAARKLIDRLRERKPQGGGQALDDAAAAALRDLIKLGPAAVPDVIAELDATSDPFLLRCLGFAARGIGDKRVVPALIRALPRACLPSSSDYGLNIADPEVHAFLLAHGHRKPAFGNHIAFGRPITEFRSALQTLTKSNHGEDELNYVSLSGSLRQQELQRALYRRCAERWAGWWDQNSRELVADARYATVGLPPRPPAVAPPPAADFPHGPQVTVGVGRRGGVLESVRAAGGRAVVKDLDTGREGTLPEKLRTAPGKAERLDDITAWAAEEGYDLICTEVPAQGGGTYYVVRGLGLTAWEVDTERRGTLGDEVKAEGKFEMGRPAGGLLAPFDRATGRHTPGDPGLFLFRTREGGFGWLFVGVEVHDDTLQPGGAAGGDPELDPVAFRKGRRYGYTLVWDDPAPAGRR